MTDHQSLFRSIEGGVHEIFDLEALKDYLDHGGDVNIKNEYGDTFLHIAVRVGKIEVVRALLDCSALVDQKNQMMDTPIQVKPHHHHPFGVLSRILPRFMLPIIPSSFTDNTYLRRSP